MHAIERKFRQRTPRSAEASERAAQVIPGGEIRNAVFHPPYSVVIDHGSGARLWDIDGNEYLDVNFNYACLVHGHAYPPVVEAATRAVNAGTFAAKTFSQIELAETIVERVASVDEVKFSNSGSEAVQLALHLARGYNGRAKLLMSNFGFHGQFLDFRRDPSDTPPAADFVDVYTAKWDDASSFEAVLAEHGHEITAVLLEPWLGVGGMVGASPEFFQRVQAAATAAGALLVLDECSVFRLHTGGAQALLDFQPDVTVLGKMIGGGFPVGGVGGRRDLMELFNPVSGKVHISGTFSGNPLTTAAGTVAVRDLTAAKIDKMAGQVETIDLAMEKSAAVHGVPYCSRRVGALMSFWFSDELPAANDVRTDGDLPTLFHLACMANGLFAVPRTLMNVSTATTDDDVKEIVERIDAAFDDLAAVI
jgi:glutamate-1-semialdehyde 2,1-aminomutase